MLFFRPTYPDLYFHFNKVGWVWVAFIQGRFPSKELARAMIQVINETTRDMIKGKA
jgi:hypothetical protein